MTSLLYQEKQHFQLLKILVIIIALIHFATLYAADLDESLNYAIGGGTIVVSLIIWLLFSFLKIRLDSEKLQLSFGLGFISEEIYLKDIDKESLRVEDISLARGIGIRYDLKGNKTYNTRTGKAIRFTRKDKGKDFSFTSLDTEKLMQLLKNELEKQ